MNKIGRAISTMGVRPLSALAFFAAAYLAFDPVEDRLHHLLFDALGLHMIQDGSMALVPYAVLMVVRLGLDFLVLAGVTSILGRRLNGFPISGPAMVRMSLIGLVTGLVVMTAAILAIIVPGCARVDAAAQTGATAALYACGWLMFDFVGAVGEELAGRVTVLLVAEPLVVRRGAILASGILFAVLHLNNPGASSIWLFRLFVQGLLLAYAVYRTGSFWWSTGYHTGWNWASAPLFGAAGSGYLDQGHLFDFVPAGPDWITGGAVGPEGSVFAFLAMSAAFLMLRMIPQASTGTRDRRLQHGPPSAPAPPAIWLLQAISPDRCRGAIG